MTRPFMSPLAAEIDGFLAFKRARGIGYGRAEFLLRAFDHFVHACSRHRRRIVFEDLMRQWLARNDARKPISVALEYSVLRQFCMYRRRNDPGAFVPAQNWAPRSTAPGPFLPHVLTDANLKAILRLAASLDRPPFRARLYRALLLVLYCTGIRFGEALRLRLCDVDLDQAVLFIGESKGRARWVPFHRSLARELQRYVVARRTFSVGRPDERLFVGFNQERLPISTAHGTLCALFRRAGLKPDSGRVGPRPYDLRHTFAVHRLERWYRAGVDIHARLPWLSAYMGHDNILGTETYLTATPHLLDLAAGRLRRHLSARGGRRS